MKKILASIVTAVMLLGVSGLAMAVSIPGTSVDTTWNGAGILGINFVSGDDAHSSLNTNGAGISGEFHATDYNDNSYGYNVDATDTKVKAHTANGEIEYTFTRDGSYSPMYGVAGQQTYTYIGSSGTGDFAWASNSNYAGLSNSNYGWQSNNQMLATGDHSIYHYLSANSNNGAEILVNAVGTTQINDMCDSAGGASYSFGKGCGCYTNANANIVGVGSFNLYADADNQITTDTGITVNGGSLNMHSEFNGGFHFGNYALTGN